MKNTTNWLIQNKLFDNHEKIIEVLERLNIDYYIFEADEDVQLYLTHKTFLYASVENVEHYYPLVINEFLATFPNYHVRKYSHHFKDYYINTGFKTSTLEKIVANIDEFKEEYGETLFIKPNSGKSFTGAGFILDYLRSEDIYKLYPSKFVIVSQYKEIQKEWRVVIIDKEVVTISLYMDEDGINFQNDDYNVAIKLMVENILLDCNWVPDRAFVMDIFLTNEGYYLGEINALNCSDFYACDIEKIITTINSKLPTF